MAGRVDLDCTARADGTLVDCSVESEFPADKRFGEAAILVARFIPVVPGSLDGVAHDQKIRISVTFPEP